MNIDTKSIALGGIIATICVAFLAIIVGAIIGRPVDDATRLAVFSAFFGMVGTATAWLGVSQVNKEQQKTALANLKAENAQSELREMQTLRLETLRPAQAMGTVSPPLPPRIQQSEIRP